VNIGGCEYSVIVHIGFAEWIVQKVDFREETSSIMVQ
jgi:hypothetical protein